MKQSFIAKVNRVLSFLLHHYFRCRFTKCEEVCGKQLPCVDASAAVLLQFMLMKQTSHFGMQVDLSSTKHQFRPGFPQLVRVFYVMSSWILLVENLSRINKQMLCITHTV